MEHPVEWNPEAIKQALDLELHPVQGEDPVDVLALARKKLKDALPFAVDSLVWLACYSENEAQRSKAATYIVDRVFGRVDASPLERADEEDELKALIKASGVRLEKPLN
jgi:hypothetical protein